MEWGSLIEKDIKDFKIEFDSLVEAFIEDGILSKPLPPAFKNVLVNWITARLTLRFKSKYKQ